MTDDFRIWLNRGTATAEMERRVAHAVLEAGAQTPRHPNDPRHRLEGDPGDLRGIPVVGRGIPGASPHTRPDHTVR